MTTVTDFVETPIAPESLTEGQSALDSLSVQSAGRKTVTAGNRLFHEFAQI